MKQTVRRHGKHCFCHECLQDEMNAKDERIEELERELVKVREGAAEKMREAAAQLEEDVKVIERYKEVVKQVYGRGEE